MPDPLKNLDFVFSPVSKAVCFDGVSSFPLKISGAETKIGWAPPWGCSMTHLCHPLGGPGIGKDVGR